MKLGKNMIVLMVALAAAILVFVLLPNTDFFPYGENRVYQFAGRYESFASGNVKSTGMSILSDGVSSDVNPQESPASSYGSSLTQNDSNLVSSSATEGFEPAPERFYKLQWGPLNNSEVLDKFGHVTKNGQDGQDGCVSSGLTNSGGYICLTPELINLLSTRGGNATGGDSQIGASPSQ